MVGVRLLRLEKSFRVRKKTLRGVRGIVKGGGFVDKGKKTTDNRG